jgi:hypothetical protein
MEEPDALGDGRYIWAGLRHMIGDSVTDQLVVPIPCGW